MTAAYRSAPDLCLAALERYAAARASSSDPDAIPEAITATDVHALIQTPANGPAPSLPTVSRTLNALGEAGRVEKVGRLWRVARCD